MQALFNTSCTLNAVGQPAGFSLGLAGLHAQPPRLVSGRTAASEASLEASVAPGSASLLHAPKVRTTPRLAVIESAKKRSILVP